MRTPSTRIVPVKKESRVVNATAKLDGSMECERANGEVFTIPADEKTMQAFVLFTMMDPESTES